MLRDTVGQQLPATGPELVIGLVTPVATNTRSLAQGLVGSLAKHNYSARVIRVSDQLSPASGTKAVHEDERISGLIDAGNQWCREHHSESGLTPLMVQEIRRARIAQHRANGSTEPDGVLAELPLQRFAYIIHSIKRPSEVVALRYIYGGSFLLVAAQAAFSERLSELARRLETHTGWTADERYGRARELIRRDASEPATPTTPEEVMQQKAGLERETVQDTRKAFILADIFVGEDLDTERPINLLFGDSSTAPTVGEYAMQIADIAATRSLSASRRVGATLVRDGAIIATGVNDVPDRSGEKPDVVLGIDSSELRKQELAISTVEALAKQGWLSKAFQDEWNTVTSSSLEGRSSDSSRHEFDEKIIHALSEAPIMDVIEYQRAVHAEMWAILEAARLGISVNNAELYGTTFPCHLCWKHIVASGISTMYYIDSYPKSKAESMYQASSSMLKPFVGIAPRLYLVLFGLRKPPKSFPSGRIFEEDRQVALPIVPTPIWNDISYRETLILSPLEPATGADPNGNVGV